MSCGAGPIRYSASFLLVMFCAATLSAAPMPPAAPTQAQITVLYDAFGKSSNMRKDWGYAALVEYGGADPIRHWQQSRHSCAQCTSQRHRPFEVGFCRNVAPPRASHGRIVVRAEGELSSENLRP
jgi:hypothetical protein